MFEHQLIFEEIEEYGVAEYEVHGRGFVFVDLIKDKMCYLSEHSIQEAFLPCHPPLQSLLQKYDPDLQVIIVIHYVDALGDDQYFPEIRDLVINQKLLN